MSSARIEIPMDEYNGMKERIVSLEKEVVSKDKEIEKLSTFNQSLKDALDDIASISLIERVFFWSKNIKKLKDE